MASSKTKGSDREVRATKKSSASDKDGRPKLRSSHAHRTTDTEPALTPRQHAAKRALKKESVKLEPAKAKRTATTPRAKAPTRQVPGVASATPGPRVRKAKASPPPPAAPRLSATEEARQLAIWIATAGLEKKAAGMEIIDVAGKVDYADFLVIMTGRSDRQVAALSQGIEEFLRQKNRKPLSVEGVPNAQWVLMDFGDVVVHIFQDDVRSLYNIEGLWMDARRISVPDTE